MFILDAKNVSIDVDDRFYYTRMIVNSTTCTSCFLINLEKYLQFVDVICEHVFLFVCFLLWFFLGGSCIHAEIQLVIFLK